MRQFETLRAKQLLAVEINSKRAKKQTKEKEKIKEKVKEKEKALSLFQDFIQNWQ